MRFTMKAALLSVVAVACLIPVAASAHLVSQKDARGDAEGPFDIRSTSMGENEALRSLAVTVKAYDSIPSRPPGMPCIAFDYRSGKGVDRVACPAMSGKRYELRESSTGKLVKQLSFTRPDKRSVRVAVSGRLLDGEGGIRWQAYLEGSGDTVADKTRWRIHTFSD